MHKGRRAQNGGRPHLPCEVELVQPSHVTSGDAEEAAVDLHRGKG